MIPPLWEWIIEGEYIINKEIDLVLDIDRHLLTPGASVIMWKKISPSAKQQLWKCDDKGHFISALNNFHLDIVPLGGIQEKVQFNDPKRPEISKSKWNVQFVSVVNNPPSDSRSQRWKYYKETQVLQNLNNGYFLGVSQFNRFVLFQPA